MIMPNKPSIYYFHECSTLAELTELLSDIQAKHTPWGQVELMADYPHPSFEKSVTRVVFGLTEGHLSTINFITDYDDEDEGDYE